jgi:hypothetical protein
MVLTIGVEPITSSLPWNCSTIGAMQARENSNLKKMRIVSKKSIRGDKIRLLKYKFNKIYLNILNTILFNNNKDFIREKSS